jgi:enamine deaminase RidA (YjgF/YER057c/UK114 family)
MFHEDRLRQIGIVLPPPPQLEDTYQPGILHNGMLYLSGQGLVLVNGAPGFGEHPKVINGCSDQFVDMFGQPGTLARAAAGTGTLPENITVEITAIFAVEP